MDGMDLSPPHEKERCWLILSFIPFLRCACIISPCIPFKGMAQVRPLHGPPVRFFQPVTLAFGDPIDFQETLDAWRTGELTETEARIRITSTIFNALAELKKKTESMMQDLTSGHERDDAVKP
ncbi:hypothetical protein K492DRAFT_5060 [Lichtheimia hyalospora FSU 10163]|nr:hypothetical protein K492DRAFT_5060 [Lichtheimia hyalospora FSU 10163]